MRFRQHFGLTEAPFLLGGLSAGDVPGPGRTVQQLACGGQLEALGNGLFGLLHGWNFRKQSVRPTLARANLQRR